MTTEIQAASGDDMKSGTGLNQANTSNALPTQQAPYFYRFALGDAKATVVSDGVLTVGAPKAYFSNISPENLESNLISNFLPTDIWRMEQNVLVIRLGKKTVLFETGLGNAQGYGKTGILLNTLRQASIDPASIDAVVLSHAHLDHCSGIMAEDGSRNFPNAQIYISKLDFDYFTDETRPRGPSTAAARMNLLPNLDRIHFIKEEEEFLPGLTALHIPGHTVGNMLFMIHSGNGQLALPADMAHHVTVLLEHPLAQLPFDTDPQQAAQSRLRMLDMLAANRIPVLGYHYPWPGIGYVGKQGEGFRFYPSPMDLG
jgi:glyoxylase-like metal-dependent hydrolase (beta-lactamase superfamily II)